MKISRRYLPWTTEEDRLLKDLHRSTSLTRLSIRLGRSVHAIQNRKSELGLTSRKNSANGLAQSRQVSRRTIKSRNSDLSELRNGKRFLLPTGEENGQATEDS